MTYKLFLDDIRTPPRQHRDAKVFRDAASAMGYILSNGAPRWISFDHDLGSDGEPTGYDFVKWLCERDMDFPGFIPEDFSYDVHSMNPVGAMNIRSYLDSYLSQRSCAEEFVPPQWDVIVKNLSEDPGDI